MDGERDSFDDLLLVDSTFPSFRFDKWMDVCEGRRGGGVCLENEKRSLLEKDGGKKNVSVVIRCRGVK